MRCHFMPRGSLGSARRRSSLGQQTRSSAPRHECCGRSPEAHVRVHATRFRLQHRFVSRRVHCLGFSAVKLALVQMQELYA